MTKWQAIVFDLDDTLYPERDYVLSGFKVVAEWGQLHLGIPVEQGFSELHDLYVAGVRGETFNRWLVHHNISPEGVVSELVQVYRDHQPAIRCFPETPALLDSLCQHFRLGLLSDGYLAVQRLKLKALGLARYFDAVVFSDEWGRKSWKPSTRPFLEVLSRLSVPAPAAAYVADNPVKDFLGARQAGMVTVWVHRSEGEYAHLRPPSDAHAPDYEVTSLTELEQLLILERYSYR